MRITGGVARSIRLQTPNGLIRPAMDRVRESVFNRLRERLQGAHVADLFAGTGAYGLEALSRGANKVAFFENDIRVLPILKENIQRVCKSAQVDAALCSDIVRINLLTEPFAYPIAFDFIFCDPPYCFWEEQSCSLFNCLKSMGMHSPTATLVLEYPSQLDWPNDCGWQLIHARQASRKPCNEPRIGLCVYRA